MGLTVEEKHTPQLHQQCSIFKKNVCHVQDFEFPIFDYYWLIKCKPFALRKIFTQENVGGNEKPRETIFSDPSKGLFPISV